MKTSELTGAALDRAVAQTLGEGMWWKSQEFLDSFHPSTDWEDGGPIIEREGLCLMMMNETWSATTNSSALHSYAQQGPTPLIAAMRCYVASKLGDKVEIPEELK